MPRPVPFLLAILAVPATSLAGQANLLNDPAPWSFEGPSGEIVTDGGEAVLRLEGQALLPAMTFADGEVTFEIRLTPRPSFAGIFVRMDAEQANGEHFYLRPHKSGEWDAVQYQPIQNGSSTWQLHSGEGYTTAVDLPAGEWIPVTIRVAGGRAEAFVGREAAEPTLRFRLESSSPAGAIALYAGFRGGARDGRPAAEFRRLRVKSGTPTLTAAPAPVRAAPDFIREWRVGNPAAAEPGPATVASPTDGGRLVTAEASGLVNLNAVSARVAGRTAVAAGALLRSDAARSVALDFDFSDDVSVFLNGVLVFSAANGWESRYPFYMGLVRPEALRNTLWLPLERGDNRLVFVVADQAFGWGFAARLPNRPAGVTIGRP